MRSSGRIPTTASGSPSDFASWPADGRWRTSITRFHCNHLNSWAHVRLVAVAVSEWSLSAMNSPSHTYAFDPPSQGWRTFAWAGGIFDTGQRAYAHAVEGVIRMPYHLVLVTLQGGARQLEVATDCGHRYRGPERAGAVSFVPARCERRVKMHDAELNWASMALRPDLFDGLGEEGEPLACEIAPFSNATDSFVTALLCEFVRLHDAHRGLDLAYCETMSHALAAYLARRYGQPAAQCRAWKLSRWRVRRITEYVDAHIGCEIAIADLAGLVGVSQGICTARFERRSA